VVRRDLSWTELFPFDASVLFPNRWKAVFKELRIDGDPESWGREHVRPLLRNMSEPYPYVACLIADGDHMGRALDLLFEETQHRDFSLALSKFAASARGIVERNHSGALIYSGGDDVLAFLPLPEALACAEDLRQAFELAIRSACGSLPANIRPTLSVGIGIGHILEAMGDLLALGREAERAAKRERNSLAVLVDMRSGGRLTWSARWDRDPAGSVRRSMEHLDELLSTRKVYEIASILRRLPSSSADALWATVMSREIRRVLSRVGEGSVTASEVGLDLNDNRDYLKLRQHVSAWVNRLLIARVFARAEPRQRGPSEEVAV
jgi:CRISPR-associated protein Cmr2